MKLMNNNIITAVLFYAFAWTISLTTGSFAQVIYVQSSNYYVHTGQSTFNQFDINNDGVMDFAWQNHWGGNTGVCNFYQGNQQTGKFIRVNGTGNELVGTSSVSQINTFNAGWDIDENDVWNDVSCIYYITNFPDGICYAYPFGSRNQAFRLMEVDEFNDTLYYYGRIEFEFYTNGDIEISGWCYESQPNTPLPNQSCATASVQPLEQEEKKVIAMYDLLGRPVKEKRPGILIYVFDDNTTKKIYVTP